MILTLRVNNGSFANIGNVAIQPVNNAISAAKAAQVPTHPAQPAAPPVSQMKLVSPVLAVTPTAVARSSISSLITVGTSLATGGKIVVPLYLNFNTQVPSYNVNLNAGKEYDPRLNQGFVTTTTQFQPFEQLTGLSQERPEVVMLTNFQPLFIRDKSHTAPNYINAVNSSGTDPTMTAAGQYIDLQFNIRNIRVFNEQDFVRSLRARYADIDQAFTQRTADMTAALAQLNVDASFLLNLVRILESQKSQLDLRHDIYVVDPTQVGSLLSTNFTQKQLTPNVSPSTNPANGLLQSKTQTPVHAVTAAARMAPTFDFVDLLTELGYTPATVQQVYSSTKVWMQTLVELSYALKFHTLQFIDIDPTYQRNDNNPTAILNPPVTRFSIAASLPNLPPLSEIVNMQPTQVPSAVNVINPAFQTIYQNVFFKDEEARLAALAHVLTKEYRYSYGLTLPATQQTLAKFYGYTVVAGQGNSTVTDAIVGKFGNNITDFPAQNTNTLASVAQQQAGGVGVLTFESQYLEGDTGTLSPGGDVFFDQVLQTDGKAFNTTNIEHLINTLDEASNAFNVVTDNLNLMSNTTYQVTNGVQQSNGSLLTTTSDLIGIIKGNMLDVNGKTSTLLQNDLLTAVFAQARKDANVKATLFLYTMAKISRNYTNNVPFFTSSGTADNTPLVNYLINQINLYLADSTTQTTNATQLLVANLTKNSPLALTPTSITSALTKGTQLTQVVQVLMSQILAQFQVNTKAITSGFTQYTGCADTVVMMVAFDLIISMIALYGGRAITGVVESSTLVAKGGLSFVVSQTSLDHSASYNELIGRAVGEDTRVQQLILMISNTMSVLQQSLQGIVNYLNSPPSIELLQQIAAILNNDPQMLGMLLSEQQIMLLAATVQNMINEAQQPLGSRQPSTTSVPSNDAQEFTVLDESQVPTALRDALLGYFGSQDLASAAGSNKRILTVGIPQGFTQRIKQKVNIQQQQKASFQNKRNDIINVCVYKTDMVNSDIVYKPQRFMFELSRFPNRTSSTSWLPLPSRPAVVDIINSIPTLNFSANADTSTATSITNGTEYASAVVAGNAGVKNAAAAFADASYSFLTTNQKAAILQNHVVSQLLEAYIKLMTGINVAEHTFDMTAISTFLEPAFVKTLVESQAQHVADMVSAKSASSTTATSPVGGVLFSTTALSSRATAQGQAQPGQPPRPQLTTASGVHGTSSTSGYSQSIQATTVPAQSLQQTQAVGNLDANLNAVSPRNVPLIMEHFRTIGGLVHTLSSVSDPTAVNQKVVSPKQFDRTFSVIIDPTDFEVDVAQTTATPYGAASLNQMIVSGDIVPSTENDQAAASASSVANTVITPGSRPFAPGSPAPNVNAYHYRSRDVNQGDVIADKYFITVETLDEGN